MWGDVWGEQSLSRRIENAYSLYSREKLKKEMDRHKLVRVCGRNWCRWCLAKVGVVGGGGGREEGLPVMS